MNHYPAADCRKTERTEKVHYDEPCQRSVAMYRCGFIYHLGLNGGINETVARTEQHRACRVEPRVIRHREYRRDTKHRDAR